MDNYTTMEENLEFISLRTKLQDWNADHLNTTDPHLARCHKYTKEMVGRMTAAARLTDGLRGETEFFRAKAAKVEAMRAVLFSDVAAFTNRTQQPFDVTHPGSDRNDKIITPDATRIEKTYRSLLQWKIAFTQIAKIADDVNGRRDGANQEIDEICEIARGICVKLTPGINLADGLLREVLFLDNELHKLMQDRKKLEDAKLEFEQTCRATGQPMTEPVEYWNWAERIERSAGEDQ